jgi:ribosomal protein S12 methylthiotransferase accessory factor
MAEKIVTSEDLGLPAVLLRFDGDNVQIVRWIKHKPVCISCITCWAISGRNAPELRARDAQFGLTSRSTSWLTDFVLDILSLLISFLSAGVDEQPFGFDVYLPVVRIRRFRVAPRQDCLLCSDLYEDDPSHAAIRLMARRKQAHLEYRNLDPTRIEVSANTLTASVSGVLGGAPVVDRLNNYCAHVSGSFREPTEYSKSMSWFGKGTTYHRSLGLGLFEALERHAGMKMRAKRCAVFDSYERLKNQALDPRDCGLYESNTYDVTNKLEPFSNEMKLRWVWGYSLTEGRPILVPLQLVYYRDRVKNEPRFVRENSNGCALGASIEEAIFFALLELIERDAFLLHWYNRLSPPLIVCDTVKDATAQCLLQRFRRNGMDIFLLDTRLDIAVPTVAAAALRRDKDLGTFAIALGSSFDPKQAVTSALMELASGHGSFQRRTQFAKERLHRALRDFKLVKGIEDHAALYGLPDALPLARFLIQSKVRVKFHEAYAGWFEALPQTLDLCDDLERIVRLLSDVGLKQIIVIDLTTPEQQELGVRTVRVLVPGITPMDFGYGYCRATTLKRWRSVSEQSGFGRGTLRRRLNSVPHPFS